MVFLKMSTMLLCCQNCNQCIHLSTVYTTINDKDHDKHAKCDKTVGFLSLWGSGQYNKVKSILYVPRKGGLNVRLIEF